MSKNIYLVSDIHLGAPNPEKSLDREKLLVKWLNSIKDKAQAIYFVGDVFDFWFEYKHVVPKGFVRFLGKVGELADEGIDIHIFAGNHDLWYKDYLSSNLGVKIHHGAYHADFFGKKYYLAHGDGLGPGDTGYKLMKKVITHPISKWLFARIHPNFGIGLALGVSKHGGNHDYTQLGEESWRYEMNPSLMVHSKEVYEAQGPFDYFIYGHRHAYVREKFEDKFEVFILGDWVHFFSYIEITENGPELKKFTSSISSEAVTP
ncbi:MAG: UDP-2,3-diacylglucosamine diphosphatase [Bacteroidia bacterium]|nr:UDP-2,3-diacylglucosamine diphosphatase [Bacteroidia bacterium]